MWICYKDIAIIDISKVVSVRLNNYASDVTDYVEFDTVSGERFVMAFEKGQGRVFMRGFERLLRDREDVYTDNEILLLGSDNLCQV